MSKVEQKPQFDPLEYYVWRSQMRILIGVKLPGEMDMKHQDLVIDGLYAECCLPLPVNREILFDRLASNIAEKQTADRDRLIGELGKQLAAIILKIVESRDTVKGYPKEEGK